MYFIFSYIAPLVYLLYLLKFNKQYKSIYFDTDMCPFAYSRTRGSHIERSSNYFEIWKCVWMSVFTPRDSEFFLFIYFSFLFFLSCNHFLSPNHCLCRGTAPEKAHSQISPTTAACRSSCFHIHSFKRPHGSFSMQLPFFLSLSFFFFSFLLSHTHMNRLYLFSQTVKRSQRYFSDITFNTFSICFFLTC